MKCFLIKNCALTVLKMCIIKNCHIATFLIALSLIGCKQSNITIPKDFEWEHFSDSSKICVYIRYTQTIEDYNVSAICLFDETVCLLDTENENAIYGKGYIHFKKGDKEFTIENNSYTDINLLKNQTCIKDGVYIETSYINHEFKTSDGKLLLETDSPFFFFDIDFDNEKELLINVWGGMGFKGYNAYEIYDIVENENPYNGITPIKNISIPTLNDFTEIDTLNRRIYIPFDFYSVPDNPYFCGQELIYEAIPHAKYDFASGEIKYVNNLVLKEHIIYDWSEYQITHTPKKIRKKLDHNTFDD